MGTRPFRTWLLVLLMLAAWAGEGMAGEQASGAAEKLYKNDAYGYTVWYPQTWFPSGIVYGNAFEIRNYDPQHPQARAAQDRASLVILDMPMGSPEEAHRFLDSLLTQGSHAEQDIQALTLDGHRAIRVKQRLKAQEPGRGAGVALRTTPPMPGVSTMLFHLSTYIANGPIYSICGA
jgi:hypothetical protein